MKIINVCGARPNFMKIAPLMDAFEAYPQVQPMIVHTGQHYDRRMSELFFEQLAIPEPDINLEVGSGSHAAQTAMIMQRFEPVVLEHKPDYVLVVGDVNSTIATALVATKLGVKVIHVEAGLRSFDRSMPEEINRLLTDVLSDMLFVSEPSGVENLKGEGIAGQRIHLVGNVMIDTLLRHRQRAQQSDIIARLGLEAKGYGVVTLHRPANVDLPEKFSSIIDGLGYIQRDMPLIFAAHPRTVKNLEKFSLDKKIAGYKGIRLIEPLGYLDFLRLMTDAAVVLTDSGGMQEETTILGVPCLTLRENTERPITLTHGTNRLVNPAQEDISAAWDHLQSNPPPTDRQVPLWDGQAAKRIAKIIAQQG